MADSSRSRDWIIFSINFFDPGYDRFSPTFTRISRTFSRRKATRKRSIVMMCGSGSSSRGKRCWLDIESVRNQSLSNCVADAIQQESFTPSNYNLFFATAVNVLVRPWEGMIRGMKFTEVSLIFPFPHIH